MTSGYISYDARQAVGAIMAAAALLVSATAFGQDTDSDGFDDAMDNCTNVANADQRDSNGDGYGNICDADLNNDLLINFLDLGLMKANFFSSDADADLDGGGTVNFIDLGLMKSAFFGAPGPSGVADAPKYTSDVQPVFQEKCTPCHTILGSGDHNVASNYADSFLPADDFDECAGLNVGQCTIVLIRSGEMPLGAGCTGDPAQDVGNAGCLTQAEHDAVEGWIAAGLPE